jgi:hypothetical protein
VKPCGTQGFSFCKKYGMVIKKMTLKRRGMCMKWVAADVEIYVKEKDYIDTALIPLIPITIADGAKAAASGGEFVQLIVHEAERQLKGRVFLFPPFTYFMSEQREELIRRLGDWTRQLMEHGMKHVFYVTCDRTWKEYENQLFDRLWMVPAIPLQDMDESYKQEIIREQTSQLLNFFISQWS